ncbi:MAG TPA: hypothetical protein VF450_00670, partial [Noviherbaspirillum sp.]
LIGSAVMFVAGAASAYLFNVPRRAAPMPETVNNDKPAPSPAADYSVDVIWEGCDVSDILVQLRLKTRDDVEGLCEIMRLADSGKTRDGFKPYLALRIRDSRGREFPMVGTREGWDLQYPTERSGTAG